MSADRHLNAECGCFFVDLAYMGLVTVSLCRRHGEQVRPEFDTAEPDPVAALRGAYNGDES